MIIYGILIGGILAGISSAAVGLSPIPGLAVTLTMAAFGVLVRGLSQ